MKEEIILSFFEHPRAFEEIRLDFWMPVPDGYEGKRIK